MASMASTSKSTEKQSKIGPVEKAMRSADFLAMTEEEKYGAIGAAIDRIQAHQVRTDKAVSDVSHQYSKYCLTMSGANLPKFVKGEKPVELWCEGMRLKYGIVIGPEERLQFRSCHRSANGGLIAAFTTTVRGSVFDKCCYRGPKDGLSSNWNGERADPRTGGPAMKLEVDRAPSTTDRSIKSLGLFLKKKDKDKPLVQRRVVQVKITPGGFVSYRTGRGVNRRIQHANEALAMMTDEEKDEYHKYGRTIRASKASQGKDKSGKGQEDMQTS